MKRIVFIAAILFIAQVNEAVADLDYRLKYTYLNRNYSIDLFKDTSTPINKKTADFIDFTGIKRIKSEDYSFIPFSNKDTILQSVALASLCLDWAQTKAFRYDGYYETNIFLGKEPSQEKVDTYFITVIGGFIIASVLFDGDEREFLQLSVITIQSYVVFHNYKNGVRIGITGKY